MSMRERFVAVTSAALDDDPRLAVVLAAISADLFDVARQRHPDRVIDVGIREQLAIGVAGGLALEGFRPVIHSYAPFLLERPYEALKTDLAHQDAAAVLVSVGASYDEPGYGRTHACPEDVALLDALTGWDVVVPGHPDEVAIALRESFASDHPTYLRLSTQQNARPVSGSLGHFISVKNGRAGVVVAVGPMLDRVVDATADLDVTVLYAACVRPWDHRSVREAAATARVAIVEPYLAGTSISLVTGSLSGLPHEVIGLGVTTVDLHRYGTPAEHDQAHGLDIAGLKRSLDEFFATPRRPGRPRSH